MKRSSRRKQASITVEAAPRRVDGQLWVGLAACFAVAAAVVAAYFRSTGTALLFLLAALGLAMAFSPRKRDRMRPMDWAVLAAGAYASIAVALSIFAANSIWYAEIVLLAVLTYLAVRLAVSALWQALVIAGIVGLAGLYLAWNAILSFRTNAKALGEVGLHGFVVFRARLISPESYVLGEWLTVLLLALPFACALPQWIWSSGKKRWMLAVSLVAPVSIVAALCLSCSRAVFWSMVLFVVVFVGMIALRRLVALRAAVGVAAVGLAVVGLSLAIENFAYPGIARAYVGRHSSQTRSTEGRIAIWKRSLDLFREHPVWGVGAGNSPLYLNASSANSGDQDETVGFASRTFSLPFQVLTEQGLVGLSLCCAILGLAAWEAFRRRDVIVYCLFAGLVAVLARELTYSSLLEHPVTAMLAATILGLICRSAG